MDEHIKILATECLQCKNPTCIQGCPVCNNIPLFIKQVKEGNIEGAYETIKLTSTLPSICSLVCPVEKQCVGHCIKNKMNKPVRINEIEQYITLNVKESIPTINKIDKKVAIIGSGPAGLACGERLAIKGYDVTIYDSYNKIGGILVYGIPDFVLNKDIVNKKVDYLKDLGINFILNTSLNKDIFIDDLLNKYDAIFLGFGASVPKHMNIPNQELKGIIDANEFLKKASSNNIDEFKDANNIIVIGGGNTAIDAARVAKRVLNKKVTIVYRRSEVEMPARKDEIIRAKNDDIEFNFLTNPVSYIGVNKLEKIECIKMELVKVDGDRARPIEIKDSNFIIDADLVIEAISSSVDKNLTNFIKTNSWGGIIVNENMQTSNAKIFAGGDCVNGPDLVVTAMKDGINAALGIINYLEKGVEK